MVDSKGTNTTDLRIRDGIEDNIKVQRMVARFGLSAIGALVCLWRYTKENSPETGVLTRLEPSDLAIVSRYSRECPERSKEFGEALIEVGFIDRVDGSLAVHDWTEEQPHISGAAKRQRLAKESGSRGGHQSAKTRKEKDGTAQPSKGSRRVSEGSPEGSSKGQSRVVEGCPEGSPKGDRRVEEGFRTSMPSMPPSHAKPTAKAWERENSNASALSLAADAPAPSEASRETKTEAKQEEPPFRESPMLLLHRKLHPPRRFKGRRDFPEKSIEDLATEDEHNRLCRLRAAVEAYSTRDREKYVVAVANLARFRADILDRLDREGVELHEADRETERAAAAAIREDDRKADEEQQPTTETKAEGVTDGDHP